MGGYLKRKNKPRGQNWLVGGGVIPCVARKFSAAILWIWISLFSSTDIRINYPKRLPLLSIAHWHLKLMAYRFDFNTLFSLKQNGTQEKAAFSDAVFRAILAKHFTIFGLYLRWEKPFENSAEWFRKASYLQR